jgi:cytoskeleton protein RodZ
VFVRGYLRNYARIVEIPVEPILRQFDEKWPDDTSTQSMLRESPRLPADGGPGRGWAGAMSWLLLIGALALFLIWWRGYLDDIVPEQIRSTGMGNPTDAIDTVMPDMPLLGEAEPADAISPDGSLRLPSLMDAPAPIAVTPLQPAVQPGGEPAAAVGAWSDTSGVAASRPSAVTAPAPLPRGTATVRDTAPLTASAAAPAADGGAPVVDAATGIVMTFSAPCWVDVRDSTRKFKLFGEMPKGTRKVLGGEPPYKFVIGNARAVSIVVNGEPFDLARYAKGNVARFTLNP